MLENLSFPGEQFERWIKTKEHALETEEANNKLLQTRLEEARVEVSELRKQLEQQQEGSRSLECLLVEAHDESKRATEQKKLQDAKVQEQEQVINR